MTREVYRRILGLRVRLGEVRLQAPGFSAVYETSTLCPPTDDRTVEKGSARHVLELYSAFFFFLNCGVNNNMQEILAPRLHLVALVLLYDGRGAQKTFEMMLEEGLFIRLMDLVQKTRDEDRMLWRSLIELLYEMSRIQRLRREDLGKISS